MRTRLGPATAPLMVWAAVTNLHVDERRPCSTSAAFGGAEEPSGSGRTPAALSAVAEAQVVHDWSPWSLLASTGTRECLEQRVCHVCGQDQIVASDCLGVNPRRSMRPAAVSIAAVTP